MDFLKILRSFEEFVFEATTWLLLYPRTLWRIVARPLSTMGYSDAEQAKDTEHRYDDALSPPILLLISVVLASLVGAALHVPQPPTSGPIAQAVYGSQQNLILFRCLLFSLVPLVAAADLVRRQGAHLARETLRAPFYAQSYLAAPCALFVSLGGDILQRPDAPDVAGLALILVGTAWFLAAQTRWFANRLAVGYARAAGLAIWALLRAWGYMLLIVLPVALF